jgi:hypothetical protein
MSTPYMSDDERELQDWMNSIRTDVRKRADDMARRAREASAANLNTPQSGGILADPECEDDCEFGCMPMDHADEEF